MKSEKRELKFFSVPQWKKEEAYLREQHKQGWKFVKVTGLGLYHFQKCEPQDVVYQLDYNPTSTSGNSEYFQLFRDCGWEYIQNYMGYSYFRKNVSDMNGTEEEIFCDDASRLDMMKRVFTRRMIPLLVIFFCIIIPQLFMQSHSHTAFSLGLTIVYWVMFCLYLGIFILFAIPFWNYYKSTRKNL